MGVKGLGDNGYCVREYEEFWSVLMEQNEGDEFPDESSQHRFIWKLATDVCLLCFVKFSDNLQ